MNMDSYRDCRMHGYHDEENGGFIRSNSCRERNDDGTWNRTTVIVVIFMDIKIGSRPHFSDKFRLDSSKLQLVHFQSFYSAIIREMLFFTHGAKKIVIRRIYK